MAARVSRIQLVQRNIQAIEGRVTDTTLSRMADDVIRNASALAPRSDGTNSFTDGVAGRTSGGRLADSLKKGFTTQRGKKVIRIFSDARNSRGQPYAGYVVRGTRAHVITGNPRLAFQWINRNTFVIAEKVNHPGTEPNKTWLTDALRRVFHR